MNKNKNHYFVNEIRNIWVHSRYDTLMLCSQKYFEIIHSGFVFQLKLQIFLDQTPNFSVLTPIFFSRKGFYNFCFKNPSENSASDQLHCYYMHDVDDLSLLKRRLSHDVVQLKTWAYNFKCLVLTFLAGVYYFLVADLFSYPWFMPAAPQLWDR